MEVRRGREGGAFVRNDWSTNSADAVARTLGMRWSQLEEHAADAAIHRAVTDATGYSQVASLTRGLLATITLGFPIEPYSPDFFNRALDEHTALVQAVIDGEVEEAGRIAQRHFAMTTRTRQNVLSRGVASSPPDESTCRAR